MLTRSELEKLALYLHDQPDRRVRLADAAAVIGDSSALQLDDVIHAAVLGDAAAMERGFERLLAEGEAPQRVLRMASLLLMRLLRLHADASGGKGLEAAVKAARPPIFWKLQDSYLKAMRRWTPSALGEGLALLQDAERRCRTGQPETAVCRAALASLLRLPRSVPRR
jgi:DNA polymerase-3 subunit delta